MMRGKDYTEILTEVSIDNFSFQVTWNPFEDNSCILWFRDKDDHHAFNALGKFSNFDKRKVLDFVVRYSTNGQLRGEIEKKKFHRKIDTLNIGYFDHIEISSAVNKERAYRNLFSLDADIEREELAERRNLMVKKFHPDRGGDHRAMTVINNAYEYLSRLSN